MNEPPPTVRRATVADLTVLARFGFALGQLHVGFDGEGFAVPPGGESAHAAFFQAELQSPDVVLLIAEACPYGRDTDRTGGVKRELPHANWTHRAHLAVGVHDVRHRGLAGALQQMRERIKAYNLACGDSWLSRLPGCSVFAL